MNKKLIEWTGSLYEVTIGETYELTSDYPSQTMYFHDDHGQRCSAGYGKWKNVEDPVEPLDALRKDIDKMCVEYGLKAPEPPDLLGTKPLLEACASLGKFLEAKNQKYGNSVNEPIQVFGPQMSPEAAFYVRMNDKISRITNGPEEPRENDLVDLAGYIMLLLARRGCIDYSHLID